MLYVTQTQQLYQPLISKPQLTDSLLQRPPFRFIHDIVREVIQTTGFLKNDFTSDDLDSAKAAENKTSKVDFLNKVIGLLNDDGSLNDVKAAKIVAGKEPELTNLLLQKLATAAAASMSHKSSKREKSKSKSSKEKYQDSKNEEDNVKHHKSKSSSHKSSSNDVKTKKSKHSSKEKERKPKAMSKSKPVDPPAFIATSVILPPQSERESSGGTSKGGDDSGIADETGADSEHHEPDYGTLHPSQRLIEVEIQPPPLPITRPMTSSGRPQTAMGRPGTAAARPAPPKIKRTKVTDIDTTTVSQQSVAFDKSMLLTEENAAEMNEDTENFIVETAEDVLVDVLNDGTNVAELTEGEHGQLVNKIIENTRKLENEAGAFSLSTDFYDQSEQKKMQVDIENVQKSLQLIARTIGPVTRSLDFIVEDFDLMLKEIDDSVKTTAKYKAELRESVITGGSASVTMAAQLRSLDDEIRYVKTEVAHVMANIIENDQKIESSLLL